MAVLGPLIAKENSSGKITKAQSNKKSKYLSLARIEDSSEDYSEYEDGDHDKSSGHRSKVAEDNDLGSDSEFKIEDDSDNEVTINSHGACNSDGTFKRKRKSDSKEGATPDPNGRVKGRDLVPWTRKLYVLLFSEWHCILCFSCI